MEGDAQHLLVLVASQLAEPPLQPVVEPVAAGVLEPLVELIGEGLRPLLQLDLVGAEERVDQLGVAQEALAEEVGGAEEREQQPGRPPPLAQQPEVGGRVAQGGGEVGEVAERLVRVGRLHRVGEQADRHRRVAHAREGGGAPGHGVDGGHGPVRVLQAAPGRDLAAAPRLHLLVGQQRQLVVERGGLLAGGAEQAGEERRHPLAVGREGGLELLHRGDAQGPGQRQPLEGGRQPVGLRPLHHLHPVLAAPQVEVRVGQRVAILHRDHAGEEQAVERRQHAPLSQRPGARLAAVEQLQRRDEELGLADAPLAELEVRGPLGAGAGVDARLHGVDLADHLEVEAGAPDEGLEGGQQLLADRLVAGAGAGLEHGVALPAATEGLVVELGGAQAVDDGAGAPLRPQVEVDAEDDAVLGGARDGLGHQLGEAGVVGEVGGGALAGGLAVDAVDEDQVDVGAEVELARAELAHGQRAEAGPGLAPLQPGRRPVPAPQAGVVEADGGVDAGHGQRRELAGHLHHPGPPQVAQRDAQHLAGAQPAQQRVEGVDVVRAEPPRGAGQQGTQALLGARAQQPGRAGGAPQQVRPAGQQAGGERGGAAEQRERLEQVALGGQRPGAVEVALQAGQRQVRNPGPAGSRPAPPRRAGRSACGGGPAARRSPPRRARRAAGRG